MVVEKRNKKYPSLVGLPPWGVCFFDVLDIDGGGTKWTPVCGLVTPSGSMPLWGKSRFSLEVVEECG